jgi:group I intron endonuclease
MSFGRIYMVTNLVNGKQYVGQTVTKHSRHGHGHAMRDAYKKYGFRCFEYARVVEGELTAKQLDCFEKFWIAVLDCIAPNGYNLESGGRWGKYAYHAPNKGKKASEETRKKMSASQRRHWKSVSVHPNSGRIVSQETRAKMSASRTGRIQSPEERSVRSAAIKLWHQKRKESANVAA